MEGVEIFVGHCRVSMVFVLEGGVEVKVRWELELGFGNHRWLIEEWLAESQLTCVVYGGPKAAWILFRHHLNWNYAVTGERDWRDENATLADVSPKPMTSWPGASEWWILVPGVALMAPVGEKAATEPLVSPLELQVQ